jgi:hypothetical protein
LLLLLQRLVLHMQNLTGLDVCSRGRKFKHSFGVVQQFSVNLAINKGIPYSSFSKIKPFI